MKKIFLLIAFCLVFIAIDFAIPKLYPLENKNSYFLGFEKFRDAAAKTVGQERIILVGGSSLGWGVSAEKLTESLDILTLNSGIHAGVGYRNFFRNISDVIDKENDIIVISPEYSIVSEGGDLGRSNEFCAISIYVRKVYPIDCIGYSLRQLFKVSPILSRLKTQSVDKQYIREGFNIFGDYIYRIPSQDVNIKIREEKRCIGWSIDDLQNKYISFIDKLISDGYKILYIPNFLPSVSCSEHNKVEYFHKILFDKYGIDSFDNSQLLFEERFFYNTAYHLTQEGVSLKTEIFREQLSSYLRDYSSP